jgi:hypothetical protein
MIQTCRLFWYSKSNLFISTADPPSISLSRLSGSWKLKPSQKEVLKLSDILWPWTCVGAYGSITFKSANAKSTFFYAKQGSNSIVIKLYYLCHLLHFREYIWNGSIEHKIEEGYSSWFWFNSSKKVAKEKRESKKNQDVPFSFLLLLLPPKIISEWYWVLCWWHFFHRLKGMKFAVTWFAIGGRQGAKKMIRRTKERKKEREGEGERTERSPVTKNKKKRQSNLFLRCNVTVFTKCSEISRNRR